MLKLMGKKIFTIFVYLYLWLIVCFMFSVPPVQGNWTQWTEWSECSAKCNGGIQNRRRSCKEPPAVKIIPCSGSTQDWRMCNTHFCEGMELLPYILRIYHECEGAIEKSVPRITVWHHQACRVMTNCDPEGRIFLCHPHMNNGFVFLLTIKYCILYSEKVHRSS